MKHLLNNLSEEEKNSIREQHEGGMRVNPSRFRSLLEGKLGNSKPLVEQYDEENELDEDSSDYRMYDLPEIHQSIEDEIEGMSDDEAIEFLKETIEFCEDKLNGYESEDDDSEDDNSEDDDFEDDLNEELADDEESKGNKLSILFKKKGKKMSKEMDVNEFAEEVVDICHGRSDYKYEKEWFFNGEVYGILRNIYKLSEEDAVGLYIKILDDVDSKIHN